MLCYDYIVLSHKASWSLVRIGDILGCFLHFECVNAYFVVTVYNCIGSVLFRAFRICKCNFCLWLMCIIVCYKAALSLLHIGHIRSCFMHAEVANVFLVAIV